MAEGETPLEDEEDDTPSKKKATVEPVPFTEDDKDRLDKQIDATVNAESRERIKSVLRPGGIRKVIDNHQVHLRSVEDALLIMDRWHPRNSNTEKRTNNQGEVVGLIRGNSDDIRELEKDALFLSALNAKISTIWSISKSAVNRAKSHLDTVKAEAKKAVAEARRAGHLRDKIKTVDQIENLALTAKAVKELDEDLLCVTEQSEILGGCYFAAKDMIEVLMHRARSLRNEEYNAKKQLNG